MSRYAFAVCTLLFALGAPRGEGISIAGRVLLEGGAPIAGARVELVPRVGGEDRARAALAGEETTPAARSVSDPEGRFRLAAPNAGLWQVVVSAKGFVPLEAELPPLLEDIVLADAVLPADAGLRVRVVDSEGAPRPGATVFVRTDRHRFRTREAWQIAPRFGITDPEGGILLPKPESERVHIESGLPGLGTGTRRGIVGTTARVRLEPGTARAIRARGKDRQPVAGAIALIAGVPYALTDAEGALDLIVDPAARTELVLLAPDGRRLATNVVAGAPEERERPLVLTLPDLQSMSGKLVDAVSRRAIAGGVVWDRQNPMVSALTNDRGAFELRGPSGARLDITAGASGYLPPERFGGEFQLGDRTRRGPVIALRPGAVIEGRVVDESGGPIAGAEVAVEVRRQPGEMRIEFGGGTSPTRNLTDERGAFRLSPIDPEERYDVTATRAGLAPGKVTVSGLEPYRVREGVEIVLDEGRVVSGRVVDASGEGVREAIVELRRVEKRGGMGMLRLMGGNAEPAFSATSDAEGGFAIPGVAEGEYEAQARRRGFARTKTPAIRVEGPDSGHDLGEIVLERGLPVQGTVHDSLGQPVEGVEVSVTEGGGMMFMMGGDGGGKAPDAVTDPTGWFVVEDRGEGEAFTLSFRRSGYVDESVKGIEVPRTEPVDVVLDPASDIAGVVLSAEGEPVAGASVTLTRQQTVEMGGNVMMTLMSEDETADAEGRFRFEDQPPGKFSLAAVASGFREEKLEHLEVEAGEDLEGVELTLPIGAVVVGQVFGPDGRPLIGARVNKVDAGAGGGFPRMGVPPSMSDGEGRYRIEGLPPGAVSIEADHEDWPRTVKDAELEEGVNELDLSFEGGREVSGRVIDTAGAPVVDATVRLVATGRYFGGPQARSDGSGDFRLAGVPDGEYELRADRDGYAAYRSPERVSVEGGDVAGLEVRLDRGATLTGKVLGLDPSEYVKVSVRADGARFGGFDGASLDREGGYRLENLAAGSYEIVASLTDSGRRASKALEISEGQLDASLDIEFEPGLTLSGRALQGDSAVRGATVFVDGVSFEHTGWGETDDQGSFEIEGLLPGQYRLNLRNWNTGLAYREDVEIATSREIAIRVPTAVVSGTVVDAASRDPLSGVTVTLEPSGGTVGGNQPAHAGATDMEGKFSIESVADGTWQLTASKSGYAAGTRAVTVEFERQTGGVELELSPTEGVTLETRLPTGAPPAEVKLAVLDPSGTALVSGTYATGENGTVRLSTVPPGTWDIIVSATGSGVTRVRATAPGTGVPVPLPPPTRLTVRVPELAEPGTKAFVRLTDAEGRPFQSLTWSGRPRSEWTMTGGVLTFDTLPPGSWSVAVTTAEGGQWSGQSATGPGQPAELRLE